MKRLRFRFERVLKLRETDAKKDEVAFAKARSARDRASQQMTEDRLAIHERSAAFAEQLANGESGARVLNHGRMLESGARAVARGADEVGQRQAALAEADERRQLSRLKLRVLEKLAERARREHRKKSQRQLQRTLDEIGQRGRRWGFALICVAALAHPTRAADEAVAEPATDLGVVALLEEVRSRNAELDRRERELEEREAAVDELEAASRERIQEIREIAATLSRRIAAWEEANGDAVRRLSKIYAAMPAPRAASLIEELELRLATQILAKMKHKESASVLALLDPIRALAVTRHVAHPLSTDPPNVPETLP